MMIKRKGVTLIELLIVVLILAALSAIAIPRISQSATQAKSKACQTNIDILNSSIELYHAEEGAYPTGGDLTLVTGNQAYFPDGAPECPITEAVYTGTLTDKDRVNSSGHAPQP
jgi:prepilin-type N-terminal cleavage/methylation domain-containing protein